MGTSGPELSQISIVHPVRSRLKPNSLKARNGFVRLLNRQGDYIFKLSILVASFCYKYCLSANTVPWGYLGMNFSKFPLSTLYGPV